MDREQPNYDEILEKILTGGDYPYYTGKTTIESVQTGNWHWVYKKVTEITEDVTLQTNNTGTTIIGSTGNDPITTRGKKILINGDAGNDSIKIFGSSYADSFIYSSGDGQRCKISRRSRLYDFLQQKNQAVTFKVDSGSVTLKDFTATIFHINGSAYKIKGTNLVKK